MAVIIQRLHVGKQLQDRRAIFRLDDAAHFGLTTVKSLFGFPLNLVCLVAGVQLLVRANNSVPSGVQVAPVAALAPVRSPSRACCFLGLSCDCCRRRSLRNSLCNIRTRHALHRPLLRGLCDPRTRHGRMCLRNSACHWRRGTRARHHARAQDALKTGAIWLCKLHVCASNMFSFIV